MERQPPLYSSLLWREGTEQPAKAGEPSTTQTQVPRLKEKRLPEGRWDRHLGGAGTGLMASLRGRRDYIPVLQETWLAAYVCTDVKQIRVSAGHFNDAQKGPSGVTVHALVDKPWVGGLAAPPLLAHICNLSYRARPCLKKQTRREKKERNRPLVQETGIPSN